MSPSSSETLRMLWSFSRNSREAVNRFMYTRTWTQIHVYAGNLTGSAGFQQPRFCLFSRDSVLLKSGSWSKKIEVAKASKGEAISVNLISSEYGKSRNYICNSWSCISLVKFRFFFYSGPGHPAKVKRALLWGPELWNWDSIFHVRWWEWTKASTVWSASYNSGAIYHFCSRPGYHIITDIWQGWNMTYCILMLSLYRYILVFLCSNFTSGNTRKCNHFCRNKDLCGHECCE